MPVNWGLLQTSNIGESALRGYQQGREMRSEMETGQALAALARNPDDQTIVEKLARYNPQVALKIGEDQRARRAQAQKADVFRRYGQGDATAIGDIWSIDPEMASKLSTQQQDKLKAGREYLGEAVYQILKLPEDQRAAAWDDYARRGVGMGFDGLGQYIGQYSPEALNSLVAAAGIGKEVAEYQEPQMFNVGPGEGRYARNPVTGEITTVIQPNLDGGEFGTPAQGGGGARAVLNGWNVVGGQGGPTTPFSGNKLDRVTVMSESGGRRYTNGRLTTSPKGAMGLFQVMPATARDPGFGIRPWDGRSQDDLDRVGQDYRRAMEKRYGGDYAKMWAAYNAGPGRVDGAMKEARERGGNWLSYMPSETKNYVRKNMRAIGAWR